MNADTIKKDNSAEDQQTMKNLGTVIMSLIGVSLGLIVVVTIIAYA